MNQLYLHLYAYEPDPGPPVADSGKRSLIGDFDTRWPPEPILEDEDVICLSLV